MLKFKVTFTFTSTSANGKDYKRARIMEAESAFDLTEDRIKSEGFTEFGARFTDNCTDWHIEHVVEPTASHLYRMPHADGVDEVRVDAGVRVADYDVPVYVRSE